MATLALATWRSETVAWMQPDSERSYRATLTSAYDALEAAIPLLRHQGYPEGIDALELASDAFTFRQTRPHLLLGLDLMEGALNFELEPGLRFRAACERDRSLQASCQDAYALRCWHLHEAVDGAPSPEDALASAAAAADCLQEASNALGSVGTRWTDPTLVTRQLPALRYRATWDTQTLPWAPLLKGLDAEYETIRAEVMALMDSDVWKGSGNDLRLSSNSKWDPHTSWDAVSLFWLGEWKSDACAFFSATCAALRLH